MCHPQRLTHSRWFTKEELQYSLSMAVMSQSGVQWCKMFFYTIIYFKLLFRLPGNLFSINSEPQPTGLLGEVWSLVTVPHAYFPLHVPINLLGFCQQRRRLHFLLPSSRPLQIHLLYGYFCFFFLGQLENLPVSTSCWECWKALLVWSPTVPTQPPQATTDYYVGFPGKCFNP